MAKFLQDDGVKGDATGAALDRIAAPVLLVDGQAVVLGANREAQRALGQEAVALQGLRSGDAVQCEFARLPGGCGMQEPCQTCLLRVSLLRTHDTGEPVVRLATAREDGGGPSPERLRLTISTEQVGKTVLVRVDEVQEVPAESGKPRG